jgi:hypothetical protein
MVLLRRGARWGRAYDAHKDPLVQVLRDVVLNGRAPNKDDRRRAFNYNFDNAKAGLPYRAPVR